MAKPRNRKVDFAVYLVVRLVVALLRAMPFSIAYRLAGQLGWVLMKVAPRRVQVARDNLRMAFPGELSDAEREALVARMFQHYCRVVVEIVHMSHLLNQRNWRKHFLVRPEDMERYLQTMRSGRPVLLVTGHFGNFEILSYAQRFLGYGGHAIARPLDNPFLERWLRRMRATAGIRLIAKNGEFDRIEEVLNGNGILATLGDQDAGARGMFVPFFGRPASTHKAIALLALRYGAIMSVGGAARVGDRAEYQFYMEDLIDAKDYKDRSNAVYEITARFTAALERMVRRHPEQYLWIHRRWKHQPVERRVQKAA